MSNFEIELSLYTPREAEKITSIKMVRQRDLRRHGYLPKQEGVAAFTIIELAQMMVLSSMMQQGIGPAKSASIAKISAIGIVKLALSTSSAWDGMEHAHWTFPGEQLPDEKAQWLSRVFSSGMVNDDENLWRITPGRFLIVFANGQELWTNSVDDEFDDAGADIAGPAMVLDLVAMAKALLKKADLPLARVVLSEEGDE